MVIHGEISHFFLAFPTIFTCWLWAVGLSEGGILQLMLHSKLLLTTPPLQPSTFSMNCNDVVKPSTILVLAFMSDLRSTWICTFFRQWTHGKHTLPSPKNTLLPCWKNLHGRWRHECFHRSWPAKTTGLVGHMDDLLILQPTGHWYNQLVFALFLGIWWSFCRIRALWPFKYPSTIQYTRWASRKDTFFYMFEVILDGWVGTWKKCQSISWLWHMLLFLIRDILLNWLYPTECCQHILLDMDLLRNTFDLERRCHISSVEFHWVSTHGTLVDT